MIHLIRFNEIYAENKIVKRNEEKQRTAEERENLTEAIAEGLKRYDIWKRNQNL